MSFSQAICKYFTSNLKATQSQQSSTIGQKKGYTEAQNTGDTERK